MAEWTIKSVVCTRTGPVGQFAVVQLTNELYAMTIDGHCLEVFTWHAGQLSECVNFMVQMSSRSMPPQQQQQSPPQPPPASRRGVSVPDGPSAAA